MILEFIKEYWGFTFFLIGLIYHALWSYFRIGDHATRITRLEMQNEQSEKTINDLKNLVTGIDAKLDLLLDGYKRKK
jgi:hypothetical protein